MHRLKTLQWREAGLAGFYRLPLALNIIVYVIILWSWPIQLNDVGAVLSGQWALLAVLFATAAVLSLIYICMYAAKTPVSRWLDAAFAALPVALITAIVLRSAAGNQWLIASLGIVAVAAVVVAGKFAATRGRRAAGIAAAAVGVLFVAALVLTLFFPVAFPVALGSLSITVIGLGFITIGLLALQINAYIGAVLAVAILLIVFLDGSVQNLRRLPIDPNAPQEDIGLQSAFIQWLLARKDIGDYKLHNRPYPVLVVSAEGGGIYAAAHAYYVLANSAGACPTFAQHLFSATGVSGGSIGLALFNAEVAQKEQETASRPCRLPTTPDPANLPGEAIITADHLSPVLAALFFVEAADTILPGHYFDFDRGAGLELAFEQQSGGGADYLASDILKSWYPDQVGPALSFVTTHIRNGQRYVLAPFRADQGETFAEWFNASAHRQRGGLRVSTAAVASSRFPWVTPTGRLDLGPRDDIVVDTRRHADDEARILADGGYFENSAADTAYDIFSQIEATALSTQDCVNKVAYCHPWTKLPGIVGCKIVVAQTYTDDVVWRGCDIPVFLQFVAITRPEGTMTGFVFEPDPELNQSALLDPIWTLLATREARGQYALDRTQQAICTRFYRCGHGFQIDGGFAGDYLKDEDLDLPLGWNLSRQHYADIVRHSANSDDLLAPLFDLSISPKNCDHYLGEFDPDATPTRPSAAGECASR